SPRPARRRQPVTLTVSCRAGGRTVAARPDAASRGRLAVDLAAVLAAARRDQARVRLLPSRPAGDDVLLALTSDAAPRAASEGIAAWPCVLKWSAAALREGLRDRVARGRRSFWQEMYLELRRLAGNESWPARVREALRRWMQHASARMSPRVPLSSTTFPRRLLREPVPVRLPAALEQQARREAAAAGITADGHVVTLEIGTRIEPFLDAIGFLEARVRHRRVIDLAGDAQQNRLLELHVLLRSAFLICESVEVQRLACLAGTPCLLVNAADAVVSYPVRSSGLFTLKTPVDLDTGELLSVEDMLTERYYRNRRNYGFRETTAVELLAAVREMHDARGRHTAETAPQARFRARATAAAQGLAARVPQLAEWGADEGFLGDGRLAAVQAERVS